MIGSEDVDGLDMDLTWTLGLGNDLDRNVQMDHGSRAVRGSREGYVAQDEWTPSK